MLTSIFTPSHNGRWLGELWRSILAQTHGRWEWVVLPNGPEAGAVADAAAALAAGDPRVRVLPPAESGRIGALKRAACEAARGDLFVEADHDDVLTPDCLAAVAAAADGLGPAFVYSDCLTIGPDGKDQVFTADYGWRNYQWRWAGRQHTVNQSFPLTARTLSDMLFAPDHVRAWTRSAYQLAGGHDPDLAVGDDHDLICRTYIAGAEFVGVPRPLYVHRKTDVSVSVYYEGATGDANRRNGDRYLHALVAEESRRDKLPMYDLGAAHGRPDGYRGIDLYAAPGVDLVADVRGGLPEIPDGSVGCFRAFDFLEHIPTDAVTGVINTLYRKLAHGGWLLTMTPAVCDDDGRCGRGAFQDPTHVSYWSSNNWWYFTDRHYAKYVRSIVCRFQRVRLFNGYPTDWHRQHLIPYVVADLCAIKDDRHWPGPVRI